MSIKINLKEIISKRTPKVGDLVNILHQVSVPKNVYNDCLIIEITESKKNYPQYTYNSAEFIYKVLYKNKIKKFRETHVSIYVSKRLENE